LRIHTLGITLAFLPAFALAGQTASPLIGARSLALSPDGSQLAFSYQGDIWAAPSSGGRAVALTSNIEMDDQPLWSPDGKSLAFTSNRNGNDDIYLVSAEGGQPRRLTYFSGPDVASAWSKDGKKLLLRSSRDTVYNSIYELEVESGRFKAIFSDPLNIGSPRYSPDGAEILYTRLGFPLNRPRYEGSGAAALYTYNLATGKRTPVRNNQLQHLWSSWTMNGIMAVTQAEKAPSSSYLNKPIPRVVFTEKNTPNVFRFSPDGKATQLTKFADAGVRFLTAATNAKSYAFERDGTVFVAADGEPKPITLTANLDDKTSLEERLILTTGVSDFDINAKGETAVFTVRGDIWTVPVKKGKGPNKDDATRITTWEGTDEQATFTPDGKAIFFVSDRDGAERLYRQDLPEGKPVSITTIDADVTNLSVTPDGKSLSFWSTGKDGGLFVVPVEGGTPKQILKRPGNRGVDYQFSPDGRYVAYADTLNGSGYYYWESGSNVFVIDVATGASTNVTQLNAQHNTPRWSSDGKYLYFGSNRSGDGIYILPLQKEETTASEAVLEFKKPTAPLKVEIDFDGIEYRIRRLVSRGLDGNLASDPEDGTIYFQSGGDIWRADYSGENARKYAGDNNVAAFRLAGDQKSFLVLRDGKINTLPLRSPNPGFTTVDFRADWTRDVRLERRAAFQQLWREFNRGFYDANFHGRDFPGLRARYEKLLPSVGHRNEFATVLNQMLGELEASHAEISPAPGNPRSQSSASLGFVFDPTWNGVGIKVKEVPARAPASFAKSKLEPGDVVLKINGKDVAPNEALYRDVLNEQIGREVTLSVRNAKGDLREVKYRAISGGEFNGIAFDNLLRARRKYVEEKSGGKLTYVHIAGMGGGELVRFRQQVWQYSQGKKGMIIDVRNNGGGNTADQIIDVLERRPNAYYQVRDESPIVGPGELADFPLVVMCAQTSFSNAEMFPNSMKSRKLATLVGMPTPGYVIYTYGLQLVDGTIARMPSTGVYRLDGSPLENMGVVPDFALENDPVEFLAGKDAQLDKAIEVLLKQAK